MQALVIYDSKFGNTEQVACAIAEGFCEDYTVQIAPLAEAMPLSLAGLDLLIVGGPTHKHGMSLELSTLLNGFAPGSLSGLRTATFDTRYHMASLLSGSAAQQAAQRLKRAGCQLIAAPKSFFMERDRPPSGKKRRHELERLDAGEVDRARAWAHALGQGITQEAT